MVLGSGDELNDLLHRAGAGDESAVEQLFERVYDELKGVARYCLRQERSGHTWQTTDLVNEAAVKLLQSDALAHDRAYFFAAVSRAMRQLLVDHARKKAAAKRPRQRVPLDDVLNFLTKDQSIDLLALDDALERLASLDRRKHDVVQLHFFGGRTLKEIAQMLGVGLRTVEKDWQFAKAWLRTSLDSERSDGR
jgi:RNA polymerase sigma factor (TIGR02999 family)